MRAFRDILADTVASPFMVGSELVTSRASLQSADGQKVAALAEDLAGWDRMDWVSITDNAGGHPMLAPSIIGRRIREKGTDVIVHITCKDRNRNGLESAAWQYDSEGLRNILCLTGDYPAEGYHGIGAPVFDLDSTTLLRMLADMNSGLKVPGRKPGTVVDLPKTDFFTGAAVSPFKNNEAELLCQYLKMELKIDNGARFLIPQLGYDMRKSHELVAYLRQHKLDVPVFGNIYILTRGVATIFNKKQIPGCYVSDRLLEKVREAAAGPDKGKQFFLELAAKQYACFKGLGYRGAYFGGFSKVDDLKRIVELGDSYGPDDWKSFARETVFPDREDFYLYAEDPATGLADPAVENPELVAAVDKVDPKEITLMFHFNRFVHAAVFEPDGLLYKPVSALYKALDGKFPRTEKYLEWQEKVFKKALFNCQDCGDCSLFDCQYMCPGANCRKNLRNGPCGGSRGPMCESADVPCMWYRAYHRAKKAGKLKDFLKRDLILRDQALKGSSSWANYFTGRDHAHVAGAPKETPPKSDRAKSSGTGN